MLIDPGRAFFAGAVGGLVASFAMSQFHSLLQNAESSPQDNEDDSTLKAASAISEAVLQRELTTHQKKAAAPLVHYGFGTSVAAAYGAAAEMLPVLRIGWGTAFGTVVWLGAHVIAVPLLGLSKPVTQSTPRREAVELGAHSVYGAVVESVRRLLRNGAR